MFQGLRLRLSLLYALSALALVAMVGGGAYLTVARYERGVTDLALQHKMAHELHELAEPIPATLAAADRDWSLVRNAITLLPSLGSGAGTPEDEVVPITSSHHSTHTSAAKAYERESGTGEHRSVATLTSASQDYNIELAAIYVLPLDQNGLVWVNAATVRPPFTPDTTALDAALSTGADLRTITTADGLRVRLLTYQLSGTSGPAALQLGRMLDDQELLLGQLVTGLLGLGAFSVALVGVGSWWLAGRALYPAQAAWERQQGFIASASHELRTPLTLIRTSTELLQRWMPASATDEHELIRDVLSESDHMRRLIDDLLMLARLDHRQLPLAMTPVNLPALFATLQRQTARLSAERGVDVVLDEITGVVQVDYDWLRQVLLNLIENALRHTPAGGQVRLSTVIRERHLRINVTDTGCGIAPEHLPHIFERFYRTDSARGRAGGNAGLGLSIARGRVEQMGGQIGAESAVGQGTTIWLAFSVA